MKTKFIVAKGRAGCILGLEVLEQLKIIQIVCDLTIVDKYKGVFSDDIGKIKGVQVKLHIDPTVKPIQQSHRRIPFGLRDKVEKEIERMLTMDIIEPVYGPTPWISPIVPVEKPEKPDKIRICVDGREANRAIQRERHITPTVDEVTYDLNGSKIFSKLDLVAGYHQVELHPDSRFITTFSTYIGLFRYKRLNFGINSASEIFQNIIRQLIAGIKGAVNLSDDILVHGPTRVEHDKALHEVLSRLKENGATVNERKSKFFQTRLNFFGMTFSGDRVSPDDKKVTAIQNAAPPTNANEVRIPLALATYVSKFIKDYATITEPLWRLTKKNVPWTWSDEQEKALNILKKALTTDTMSYFNPKWQTEIVTDASPVGLGAVLAQINTANSEEHKIILYASRLLHDTERRYSQIEKEALAAVWACERFHLYVFARKFDLVTDNDAVPIS
jgi:hypothetical protein